MCRATGSRLFQISLRASTSPSPSKFHEINGIRTMKLLSSMDNRTREFVRLSQRVTTKRASTEDGTNYLALVVFNAGAGGR